MELRLERDRIYTSTINVPGRSDRRRRLVAPGRPEESLLYLKVLEPRTGGYAGPRMPMRGDPLQRDEIAAIREWILSFDETRWVPAEIEQGEEERAPKAAESTRVFADSHLVNLPAPETIPAGMLQYRILHRFRANATDAGGSELYGMDSGAWISFGVAYGVGESLELGLRRTNFERNYELHGKWGLLRQSSGSPLSLALQASAIRLDGTSSANRDRYSAQLSAGARLGERLSAALVPTYVSRANFQDERDDRGSLAIGAGLTFRITEFVSLSGEWVGQIDGVEAPYQGVSLGLEIATSKHVFHVMISNSPGLHTDLYAPGGDLDFVEGDFRIGFNISRLFDLTYGD